MSGSSVLLSSLTLDPIKPRQSLSSSPLSPAARSALASKASPTPQAKIVALIDFEEDRKKAIEEYIGYIQKTKESCTESDSDVQKYKKALDRINLRIANLRGFEAYFKFIGEKLGHTIEVIGWGQHCNSSGFNDHALRRQGISSVDKIVIKEPGGNNYTFKLNSSFQVQKELSKEENFFPKGFNSSGDNGYYVQYNQLKHKKHDDIATTLTDSLLYQDHLEKKFEGKPLVENPAPAPAPAPAPSPAPAAAAELAPRRPSLSAQNPTPPPASLVQVRIDISDHETGSKLHEALPPPPPRSDDGSDSASSDDGSVSPPPPPPPPPPQSPEIDQLLSLPLSSGEEKLRKQLKAANMPDISVIVKIAKRAGVENEGCFLKYVSEQFEELLPKQLKEKLMENIEPYIEITGDELVIKVRTCKDQFSKFHGCLKAINFDVSVRNEEDLWDTIYSFVEIMYKLVQLSRELISYIQGGFAISPGHALYQSLIIEARLAEAEAGIGLRNVVKKFVDRIDDSCGDKSIPSLRSLLRFVSSLPNRCYLAEDFSPPLLNICYQADVEQAGVEQPELAQDAAISLEFPSDVLEIQPIRLIKFERNRKAAAAKILRRILGSGIKPYFQIWQNPRRSLNSNLLLEEIKLEPKLTSSRFNTPPGTPTRRSQRPFFGSSSLDRENVSINLERVRKELAADAQLRC